MTLCPFLRRKEKRLALVCHILLVGFDHLLERVTRTTFELFQIPHGAFTGEKFDLQLDFIIIDCYKDAVDIFLHKVAVDESVHRIVAGGLQHAADLRDVCVEVGAGVLLLLKLGETAAALLDLFIALTVHFEKIRVRDLSGDIILEQLALFLFGEVTSGALFLILPEQTHLLLTLPFRSLASRR